MSAVAERLSAVREDITARCKSLGRDEPTLIVVTKNHPVSIVDELFELGVRDFGENRVQEAAPKFQEFTHSHPERSIVRHHIGQLQTNKVKTALGYTDVLHTVDRPQLLQELVKRTAEFEHQLPVFIQVNLTTDPNRGGIASKELQSFAMEIANSKKLRLLGLMAVASLDVDPRLEFEKMALLSQSLIQELPTASKLSIGMSHDYADALEFGATHLRIGTAITGIRTIGV